MCKSKKINCHFILLCVLGRNMNGVVFESHLFGWQNNCLHSKTNLPPILMLIGKLECPKSPNWPKNCIQWLIHKDKTLTTKRIPRRTFSLFAKNKNNFFQHCYFILSESCPFLHGQHCKHKRPINCTFPSCACHIMIQVIVTKL